jgi:hypothetical protein
MKTLLNDPNTAISELKKENVQETKPLKMKKKVIVSINNSLV